MVCVAARSLNGIALCAGVGMLDEGVRLALEHLGFEYRTIAYVEREAAAAAQLVALMEAGCIDSAPVWSDLLTFDTRPWRGVVDSITAGFPCQPHSVAGKREGLEDERWIWPAIAGLIGDLRPRFVWLENVPGLASTGGLDACIASLAARGYSAEWARLSAAAVGASHERERLFIFGWLADAGREHIDIQQRLQRPSEHSRGRSELENAARHERPGSLGESGRRREVCEAGNPVGESTRIGSRERRAEPARRERRPDSVGASGAVGEPDSARRPSSGTGLEIDAGDESQPGCRPVADAIGARLQGRELARSRNGNGEGSQAHGSVSELCGAFAPGPSDPRWPTIIERFPFLAPATESGVRGLADGLALVVDESRTDQLRAVGNGVVALTAACAYVELARRAGLKLQHEIPMERQK